MGFRAYSVCVQIIFCAAYTRHTGKMVHSQHVEFMEHQLYPAGDARLDATAAGADTVDCTEAQ